MIPVFNPIVKKEDAVAIWNAPCMLFAIFDINLKMTLSLAAAYTTCLDIMRPPQSESTCVCACGSDRWWTRPSSYIATHQPPLMWSLYSLVKVVLTLVQGGRRCSCCRRRLFPAALWNSSRPETLGFPHHPALSPKACRVGPPWEKERENWSKSLFPYHRCKAVYSYRIYVLAWNKNA